MFLCTGRLFVKRQHVNSRSFLINPSSKFLSRTIFVNNKQRNTTQFSYKMSQFFINGSKDDANIREFDTLDGPVRELILAAVEARKHAYCPYSNFAVGAAIRTTDGSIYTGCNIENGAYTAGICAERTAAAKAISEGKREFVACAVVAQQEGSFTTPCGVCRQFLAEFANKKDFPLYAAKPISPPFRVLCTSIMELLPKTFLFEQ